MQNLVSRRIWQELVLSENLTLSNRIGKYLPACVPQGVEGPMVMPLLFGSRAEPDALGFLQPRFDHEP